jgi:hypothetical protein
MRLPQLEFSRKWRHGDFLESMKLSVLSYVGHLWYRSRVELVYANTLPQNGFSMLERSGDWEMNSKPQHERLNGAAKELRLFDEIWDLYKAEDLDIVKTDDA